MTYHEIRELLTHAEYPALSLIIKTERAMPEAAQNRIRIKNAVKQGLEKMQAHLAAQEFAHFEKMLLTYENQLDVTRMLDGLAIFATKVAIKAFFLPVAVEDRVSVAPVFAVRELVKGMQEMPSYWVLTLSPKMARLYSGHGKKLEEIVEPEKDQLDVPRDGFPFWYLGPSEKKDAALDSGDQDSRYADDHKKNFMRKLDFLLHKFIEHDPRPLFIVGTPENRAMFREISQHKQQIAAEIEGLFDHKIHENIHEFFKVVWPHVQAHVERNKQHKVQAFIESLNGNNHVFNLREVWLRAYEGRIKDLIVESDFTIRGIVDPENPEHLIVYDRNQVSDKIEDLVDHAIAEVILKDGTVTLVEPRTLLEYDHIAGILRY